MSAAAAAARFDKPRRDGRGWRFACPLCRGHGWVREYEGAIKIGCWGCGDWKGVRRIAFGNEKLQPQRSKPKAIVDSLDARAELARVLAIWRKAEPIKDTLGETYLRCRGLSPKPFDLEALRFISSLWHWPTRTAWPALVALIRTHDGRGLGLHETFLAIDGAGKAPLEKARLYRRGLPIAGGGVWFGTPDPGREFLIAEGVESLLSGLEIFSQRAGRAALSAHGVRRLILPPEAKRVRIFADHDREAQGLAAAGDACRRWRAEGRTVAVSMAAEAGLDANDVLRPRQNP